MSLKLSQNDSSNLDIKELAKKVRGNTKVKELQSYANKLYETALAQLEKISALESEITHLKELLTNASSALITKAIPISQEESIAMKQIEELKRSSDVRILTLEEVKKYDLLVKNLKLIRGEEFDVPFKSIHLASEQQLIEAAKKDGDE